MKAVVERTVRAYYHLVMIEALLTDIPRPRKHPGGKRPLAVGLDGQEYSKASGFRGITKISLVGAFEFSKHKSGVAGFKMAKEAFEKAYWHYLPTPTALEADHVTDNISKIDFYERDTRELLRAIRRAKKSLLKEVAA